LKAVLVTDTCWKQQTLSKLQYQKCDFQGGVPTFRSKMTNDPISVGSTAVANSHVMVFIITVEGWTRTQVFFHSPSPEMTNILNGHPIISRE